MANARNKNQKGERSAYMFSSNEANDVRPDRLNKPLKDTHLF
jgi:hypothetical protein